MNQTEIEQMRARVAVSWGVELGAVKQSRLGSDEFFFYDDGKIKLSWEPKSFNLIAADQADWISIYPREWRSSSVARLASSKTLSSIVTRFLFCMDYPIQFLIDAGVTVTAHDQLEWALQMRDAGFPLG